MVLKSRNNIISISSGNKAEVGKTWFSVTLSHALSLLGNKVLLFDGDWGLSNVSLQLGIKPPYDINDVLLNKKALNQIVYVYDNKKLDIILQKAGSLGLASLSVGQMQVLGEDLKLMSKSYNNVILDSATNSENPVHTLSSIASEQIILSSADPSSLTEAYELLRNIRKHLPEKDIKIVINLTQSLSEGHRAYESLRRASMEYLNYEPKLLGVIRRDARVRDSIRNKVSIISRYPSSEASLDVMEIAKRLI